MGDLLKQGETYAKKTFKEQWKKEKKSFKSSKSKNQPLGDKDDPVDEIVRIAASFVGTVSEAYQYRKERKQAGRGSETSASSKSIPQEEMSTGAEHGGGPVVTAAAQSGWRSASSGEISNRDRTSPPPAEDFSEAAWQADESRRSDSVDDMQQAAPGQAVRTQDETSVTMPDDDKKKKKPGDFAKEFIARHPLSPLQTQTRSPIDLPVVIPQRRPKDRGRGFVRAYSPVLAAAGIEQPEFLDFIDSFNRATVPSEWIQVMDLVGIATVVAPPLIGFAVDAALEVTKQALTEAQGRYRGGRFIDRVNAEYFIPRGLVAMAVTWKSWDGQRQDESDRPTTAAAQSPEPTRVSSTLSRGISFEGPAIGMRESMLDPNTGFKQSWSDVRSRKSTPMEAQSRLSSHMQQRMKRYNGVFECPKTAPLVFPSIAEDRDVMVTKANGKKMNSFDRGEQWINGFRDRRSQVKWAAKTLDSQASANMQKHEFRSKYADPSHPAASGDIVAFATGGKWSTRGRVKQPGSQQQQEEEEEMSSGEERAEQKWLKKKEKEDTKRRERARKKAEKEKKGESGLSNLLRTDVLYLVIVNVPTPEERAAAAKIKQEPQEGMESTGDVASGERSSQRDDHVQSSNSHRHDVSAFDHRWEESRRDGSHLPSQDRDQDRYLAYPTEPTPSYEEVIRQGDAQAQAQGFYRGQDFVYQSR